MSDEHKDPVGRWFTAMEAHGDHIDVRACRLSADGETWHTLPHARRDGIGALLHLSAALGERAVRVGVPPPRPAPAPLARARLVARQVLHRPRPSCSLRTYQPDAGGEIVWATRWWTADETAAAEEAARRAKISLNTALFHAFDAAVSPCYDGDAPALWMMPVNMRESVGTSSDEGNYLAFVNVPVGRGASALDVHATVRDTMIRQEHWAVWDLWRLMPDRAVARITAREYAHRAVRRAGTFSNLGRWEGEADGWALLPTVSRPAPLGAAVIAWNGRLLTTAAAHPAAGVDAATLSAWLERLLIWV